MKLAMIISGGQTGADMGGLLAACRLGLATGGWCPAGWRTETGSSPGLVSFGLKQTREYGYERRTALNVRMADVTLIFARYVTSPGTKMTVDYCNRYGRDCFINPTATLLQNLAEQHEIWNVAGNRESKAPNMAAYVEHFIVNSLTNAAVMNWE